MIGRRGTTGQTLPVAIVALIVLVIIGLAFIFYQFIMGGHKELANAVDAGNLNVAVVALKEPTVVLEAMPNPDCLIQFRGVAIERAPDKHDINLSNINRVWAQAMLVALNVKKMQGDQTLAWQHSKAVYQAAREISKSLSDKLKGDTDHVLEPAFSDMATENSLRMLNMQAGKVVPTKPAPEVSYVDRPTDPDGAKGSNIQFFNNQGLTLQLEGVAPSPLVTPEGYAIGYKVFEVQADGDGEPESFAFVPLEHDTKHKLISTSYFSGMHQSTAFLDDLADTLPPNSFSYSARVMDSKAKTEALQQAFALVKNPDKGFPAALPEGFFRIRNMPGKDTDFTGESGDDALHVLDYSNRAVGEAYRKAFEGINPGADGTTSDNARHLFARTALNPIEIPWGWAPDINPINLFRALLCLNPQGKYCHDCDGLGPLMMPCRLVCCMLYKFLPFSLHQGPFHTWLNAFTPTESSDTSQAGGQSILSLLGMKFTSGYFPTVSQNNDQFLRYEDPAFSVRTNVQKIKSSDVEINRIYYDWERGNYLGTLLGELIYMGITASMDPLGGTGMIGMGTLFNLLPFDLGLMLDWFFHMLLSQDITVSDLHRYKALINPDVLESGMRLRDTPNTVGSVFWNAVDTPFPAGVKHPTHDGSIRSMIYDRRANSTVSTVYALVKERLRQLSPQLSDADIDAAMMSEPSANTPLPMNHEAYVFLDETGRKLKVAHDTEPGKMPVWLKQRLHEQPDSDLSAITEVDFAEADSKRCYKLVRIGSDWGDFYSGWPFTDQYPVNVCVRDTYKLIPSSGHKGLVGVLELRSRVHKRCLPSGASWNEPEDCF